MKFPKYKLAFPGKHSLVFNGHPMTQFDGYTLGTYASGSGVVSASKQKGFWGESAELFQSAAQYHSFEGYSANKGTINGNTYIFGKGDAVVTAFFNETEIYNLFLSQTQGGTITGNPMTGHSGQYIVLSALPSSHYNFNGYNVTGGVLSGDKVIIGNSDMTAQASWIEDPKYSLTLQQTNGGTIYSDKSSGYDGDLVVLSNTPSAGYSFSSYNITGAELTGNKFNFNGSNVTAKGNFTEPDPYNPLGLPPYTIRVKYANGVEPYYKKGTARQVSVTPNVWDITHENNDWSNMFSYDRDGKLIEVLGANTHGVTNMGGMFQITNGLTAIALFDTSTVQTMNYMFSTCKFTSMPLFDTSHCWNFDNFISTCLQLTAVPHFDTSNGTNMPSFITQCYGLTYLPDFNTSKATNLQNAFGLNIHLKKAPNIDTSKLNNTNNMFRYCGDLTETPLYDLSNVTSMSGMYMNCNSLTSIPLFDTSKVTNMASAFCNCYKVQSGASALYNQVLFKKPSVTYHGGTFRNCGRDTAQGSAELAEIISTWK